MLTTKLNVVSVGKPDITTLSEIEQRVFFQTLYS